MRYKDTYTISEITRNSIAKKYIYSRLINFWKRRFYKKNNIYIYTYIHTTKNVKKIKIQKTCRQYQRKRWKYLNILVI